MQIFEMFVLSCNLLVNLCPHSNSSGGAEDKARKQVNDMSSFYIKKKAFIEGHLLIDLVCIFDAYLISHLITLFKESDRVSFYFAFPCEEQTALPPCCQSSDLNVLKTQLNASREKSLLFLCQYLRKHFKRS